MIIVRTQGHVYTFNASCPHENTALEWLLKDNRFQFPPEPPASLPAS